MPTGTEFEAAAAEFSAVSAELQQLSAGVRAIDSSAVLQGGRLGQLVPDRLASCANQAASAAAGAEAAAQVCRARAAIIAAYEAKLAAYEAAMVVYDAQMHRHYLALDDWNSLYEGREDAPAKAPEPQRPIPPPVPSQEWAEVRQPR